MHMINFTNSKKKLFESSRAHSEPIFKQLHLLKSYDIYKCQLLKFLFKLVNKQLPTYFNQLPFSCTTMRQEDVNEFLFQELITSSQKET